MTHTIAGKTSEDLRPRLIVWDLTSENTNEGGRPLRLDRHECLLVLDSIARTSKPIIVLKGPSVINSENIYEIVEYGRALDLKMVIELQPEELIQEVIDRYRNYGVRIFRLILDKRINEDPNTRFQQSQEFIALENAVKILQDNGFDLHFSITLENLNRRSLSYYLDYAFLKKAKGLYCHLRFQKSGLNEIHAVEYLAAIDEFLLYIPDMKERVPSNMYLSPQCIRYMIATQDECDTKKIPSDEALHWIPTCLAGRTFGYLDAYGKLYLCQGSDLVVGDLRTNGYDFKYLWSRSGMLNIVRSHCRSCSETRKYIEEMKLHKNFKPLVVQENIRNMS